MTAHHQFTSESVTEGHPDKLADQIADDILDAALYQDPDARVAVEVLLTTGLVHIAGEITTTATLDPAAIARRTLHTVGYTAEHGLDPDTCAVLVSLDRQSPDIANGVSTALEARGTGTSDPFDLLGAGDQGLMFGYACDETPELMPAPISVAHALARQLSLARRNRTIAGLRPDGKTQVTFTYDAAGNPTGIDTVVISTQHDPGVAHLAEQVRDEVVNPVLASGWDAPRRLLVNPSGQFIIGGPVADTGLTGRKLAVDTYGGYARNGGGALSGKDPSKVDRSAAYAARWVAKNVVAAGLADRCEVQIAYAIGSAYPVGLYVETFGTGKVRDEALTAAIRDVFDLRPAAIIDALNLRRPIYGRFARYGHFGRQGAPWEATNRIDDLLSALG